VTSQHAPGSNDGQDAATVPGPDDRAVARRDRAWRTAAAALAAAFTVLLPAAMTSTWIRGTVLSTSGYVAAVTPVAANPVVRAAVQETVTSQIDAALSHVGRTLPPAAGALAGPLSSGLAHLAGNGISRFMASPVFERLWGTVNRFTHSQLISALNGNSALVATTGGQVVLDLAPLVNDVLHSISGRLAALSGGAITLPSISAIPAAACHALARMSHRKQSSSCGQIPLFPASALAGPRLVFRALNVVTALVLVLTPLAFACALVTSRGRRRTLLQMAIGGTLTLLAVTIALARLLSTLSTRTAPRYQAVANVVVHALTNNFFTMTTWIVAGGFALTAVTLLSGPYRWSTTVRTALRITR
jgi:hypothetical protein